MERRRRAFPTAAGWSRSSRGTRAEIAAQPRLASAQQKTRRGIPPGRVAQLW